MFFVRLQFMPKKKIKEVIARRTDLSTFLVHLTRSQGEVTAKDCLKKILKDNEILAQSAFGMAKEGLSQNRSLLDSQKCVCFTETPLEYLHLMIGEIEGRRCDFSPYGIAITKKLGRKLSLNPIWYVDITSGHDWLTEPINQLIDDVKNETDLEKCPILKIAPFIETMGTDKNYRKEFWWEREWRHVGNFRLPRTKIILCPENEFNEFNEFIDTDTTYSQKYKLVDPNWGLEEIIARLAGFSKDEINDF